MAMACPCSLICFTCKAANIKRCPRLRRNHKKTVILVFVRLKVRASRPGPDERLGYDVFGRFQLTGDALGVEAERLKV
jgi:hypothetical protein